jgi:hypothetical protein
MSEDAEKEGKQVPSVTKSEKNTTVEKVPRTNTGVEIDNPEEMEEVGEEK